MISKIELFDPIKPASNLQMSSKYFDFQQKKSVLLQSLDSSFSQRATRIDRLYNSTTAEGSYRPHHIQRTSGSLIGNERKQMVDAALMTCKTP